MQPEQFLSIRKRLGLTQKQLADTLGVSIRYIGYIESGLIPIAKRTEYAMLWLNISKEYRAIKEN